MQIKIKEISGRVYELKAQDEMSIEDIINKIDSERSFVTFNIDRGASGYLEVAIAKEHIVSITTIPESPAENEKRKGRQLLF